MVACCLGFNEFLSWLLLDLSLIGEIHVVVVVGELWEHIPIEGWTMVLKIYCLSIVETDKVILTVETDIVKLVVEIESFGMSSDEFDKETGSSDGLPPKQVDLNCVHALNELHLHEIRVVPSKHEADQY
ncbi:hypothetical protein Tco_0922893 [Tanacetum coccineum]|uniref:Uncharacterized protein n=1 Tax=Tanacetum coccineum TaxID=301880 RepID=A0ABQ5D5U5_9ASTR